LTTWQIKLVKWRKKKITREIIFYYYFVAVVVIAVAAAVLCGKGKQTQNIKEKKNCPVSILFRLNFAKFNVFFIFLIFIYLYNAIFIAKVDALLFIFIVIILLLLLHW